MALATDVPKESFRLSMLIYDTRFRSITIQVVVLLLFLLLVGWLVDNTVQNLAAKDKDISFGFLWQRAGYDIEQQLIPYTNDSTHGRATIIGLLNTLAVAALGCVFATVIGVFAGVLRLSNNWIVGRLMTVYVEIFRNVPLLLWIILIFVVTSETQPAPSDFKVTAAMIEARAALAGAGTVAESAGLLDRITGIYVFSMPFFLWLVIGIGLVVASWQFAATRLAASGTTRALIPAAAAVVWIGLALTLFNDGLTRATETLAAQGTVQTEPANQKMLFDSTALTNRGAYVPAPILDRPLGGTEIATIPVNYSVLATLAVIALSVFANLALLRRARAIQEETGNRPTTWWQSLAILFLPTIALLWAMGFHLDIPAFATDEAGVSKGFNFQGGILVQHSFTALVVALSLYTGAFIAEIVRSGIMAISRGQSEAAFALGLRPGRTMNLIILPQALRVIIPPLISQYLNLTKNTSLGIAVSYLDLKGTLGGISLNQTGRELECMLLMMLIYLIISLLISSVMNVFNAAVKLKER
ncbi:ABC transporter permease subunit [Rhodobacter sp. Har01]|uniref:amino acid ABC transporter permease n=1 Tax=Rhodobacter sp. Har01 TaxID=2883999 RepID=UPI001D07907D|nr:ABC transporter permease subunit [Rhodobacter sp. Har01]MCB6180033.1 ABC transporter permease subunit [Rhodobacter sp. Har01]